MNEIAAGNLESVRKVDGRRKVACINGPKRLQLRVKRNTGRGKTTQRKAIHGKA